MPLNLYYSNSTDVEHAYIVTMRGHEKSEKYSAICQESCKSVGMPYIVWDAYDGSSGTMVEPEHSRNNAIMGMLKLTDPNMSPGELGCALSHISLWSHCAEIDKPIVVLEHDAIMVKRFTSMQSYNSIVYLGCIEQASGQVPMGYIPLFGTAGRNINYLLRTHAYAIDPPMAKNLLANVLKNGIWTIADRMMRADLFNITHQGIYAYDHYLETNDSTIVGRAEITKDQT